MTIPVPQIDIPRIVFGDNGEGVGRGPGKEGDVIGRDPQPGQGTGGGTDEGEGIRITLDLEDVLKFMEDELKLPFMKPKPSQTFEEKKVRYNNISRVGLNSLRHVRRTMKEAIKRRAMCESLDETVMIPGCDVPMNVITPIKGDFRYRQWKEEHIPASNAVIFFCRDCSGSMSDYHCDIVSDMCWWLDCWIKKFYKRLDRCYYVHDSRALEVNEEEFYSTRAMGGTICSTVFEMVADQLENRYPPDKYNIYLFYFTDGDNYTEDNQKMIKVIKEKYPQENVNLIGLTQICAYNYSGSVKQYVDNAVKSGELGSNIKTASIGPNDPNSDPSRMDEEDRNQQIIGAIKKLLTQED